MDQSMGFLKTSRKFHKWLMLFVGVQFVIWSITGAYMVFFDIDYIQNRPQRYTLFFEKSA
jgi:uncharacterized iron-regulated membrane protein